MLLDAISWQFLQKPKSLYLRPTDIKEPSKISVDGMVYRFSRYGQEWECITKSDQRWNHDGIGVHISEDNDFYLQDHRKSHVDYSCTQNELWHGFKDQKTGNRLCNGLINDWSLWLRGKGDKRAKLMSELLQILIPEFVRVGPLTRVSLDDVRDFPTLNMSFVKKIPVTHLSAGYRRLIGLAYSIVWLISEHELYYKEKPSKFYLIMDGVENHLSNDHRSTILESLLEVVEKIEIPLGQMILSTQQTNPRWKFSLGENDSIVKI
jgi:hypothetical protein